MTKFGAKQIFLLIFNLLLLGLLSYNLINIYQIHQEVQSQLQGNILSSNPDLFIRQISSQDVAIWVWVVNIAALLFTLFLVVRQFLPGLSGSLLWHRINLFWLLAWLTYLVVVITLAVIAITSVFV